MMERFSHLRRKEVINICDGRRLGFVGDLELKVPEGEVKALIDRAYGRCETLLKQDLQKVTDIADYLMDHDTMDRETFEAAMQPSTP